MSLEFYTKEETKLTYYLEKSKKKDRLFGYFLTGLGIVAILIAALPTLSWFFTGSLVNVKIEKNPIPRGEVLAISDLSQDIEVKEENGFSYFSTNYKPHGSRPAQFKVTIPKLEIKDAIAKVDNLNFFENLSHFPGSALPGEQGNVFITGHSVLPQFADPQNYRAIFTKLSDLEAGDVINIDFEGKTYKYVVQYKKVVEPKDLSVLLPITKTSKNLTLMTCVPPGTSLKRMVVITSLI